MKHIGVVIADHGSAIVHADHDGTELLATALERLPFDLSDVAARVRELDLELAEARFVIDAGGLGEALWTVLGSPAGNERWRLYSARGLERQALVDVLLVAVEEGRFHFAPGLPEQPAMNKALQSYRRQVKEDGIVGSELVVALLLALLPEIPRLVPLVSWGGPILGAGDDRPDDVSIGSYQLRRGPDGQLLGINTTKERQ